MKHKDIRNSYCGSLMCVMAFLLFPTVAMALSAQKQYMMRGNSLFKSKQFAEAEVFYRKALECDTTDARVKYNLGNALLAQQKPKEAMQQYEKAVEYEKNPYFKAAIYHNMGVILQAQKQFGPAIECYKNSLRNYSIDDRTRYNLALCMHQLKNDNSQQSQNDEQKQDEDNKNQNKDEQKQQQKQEDEQQQQKDNSKMSKENADQMLKAAMMQENKTQQKVREAIQNQRRRNLEKNW